MYPLKRLSAAAIPRALEKAERYRLISQPWAAESICLDVLAVDPGQQAAWKTLLLARTDQFRGERATEALDGAREALSHLSDRYETAYYEGMIAERRAMAKLEERVPGAGAIARGLLEEAMRCYETAASMRPSGNDDAVLRWNTCARLLNESPQIVHARSGQDDDIPIMNE
jgi:tetratricopeptide (TPR) repeat protein